MTTQSVPSARDDSHPAPRDLPTPGTSQDDEETGSNYGYHSGYQKPIGIPDQIDVLRGHWPGLDPDRAIRYHRDVYPTLPIPRRQAEGAFAIVRPGFFSDQYGEELAVVFEALSNGLGGRFANYRDGQLGPEYLRQDAWMLDQFTALAERQPESDILVVPAQLGLYCRGRSPFRACRLFSPGEFGLGAKDVGMMLLANPVRLQHDNDLWVSCPGDSIAPSPGLKFSRVPRFSFVVNRIVFSAHWIDVPEAHSGSASFFLAQ